MAQIALTGSVGVPGSTYILGNITVNFASDADHTLTAMEWSNHFINVTGTISTVRKIIGPLNQGQEYSIQNNTTGGHSIQIIGASGTGIIILNGSTATVTCDGINYIVPESSSSIILNGDVTGTANANTVTKIQNNNIVAEILGSGQDGYVLTWDNSDGYWKSEKTGISFTAGGDLSGTNTNQTVQSIQGINISGTPSIGNTLIATSSSAASWQSPVIPTGITSYGTYASRPTASGSDVLLYQTADGPVDYVNNGSVWLPKIPGAGTPGSEVAPGNTSPFTVIHSGSGTTTNTIAGGCVSISTTNNGGNQAVQLLQTSLSGNQGPQAWLQMTYSTICSAGVFVRNTTSGNMVMFVIDMNGASGTFLSVLQYSNQTNDAGGGLSDINTVIKQPIGMRLRNDGTNWYAETSTDGISWRTAITFSISLSWYLGGGSNKGNACGICINPYSSPGQMSVLAYDVK